jgi:endonuclease YncB( thermonuclease family)
MLKVLPLFAIAALLASFLVLAGQATATEISGPARAIDSTAIEIKGQRIMLFGIDSVMRKQACKLDGKIWACWTAAVHGLQTLVDQGPVTCESVGDPDAYGRILGRCTVNGKSLNEEMVQQGYAVARTSETTDYVAAEKAARESKVGLWQGDFMRPDEFRRAAGIFVDRP